MLTALDKDDYHAILAEASARFLSSFSSIKMLGQWMSEEEGSSFHMLIDVLESKLRENWTMAIDELIDEVRQHLTERTWFEDLPTLAVGCIFRERIGPLRLTVTWVMPQGGEGTEDVPEAIIARFDCAALVYQEF